MEGRSCALSSSALASRCAFNSALAPSDPTDLHPLWTLVPSPETLRSFCEEEADRRAYLNRTQKASQRVRARSLGCRREDL